MKEKTKKIALIEAIATLVGTIIGAGVLGIPYAISRTGFFPGLIILILLGLAIMMVNLFLGEVILRTKETCQLPGYAEKYLGKKAKKLMAFSMIFGTYGALIAYLIGEGEALSAIFGGKDLFWSIGFWIFGAILLYIGLNIIKTFELIMMAFIFVVILLISLFSLNYLKADNILFVDMTKFFMPYGVVLFAYLGASAIQQVREILTGQERKVKSAIVISSFIPFILYTLFAFVVIGVTGIQTSQVATIGLGDLVGKKMILFGNIFAIFAMGTSFLTLGLALKYTLTFDFKLNKNIAWALAVFMPLIAYLIGVKDFIKTISYVGAIVGGIEGILIVLIYWKAKEKGERKPEYSFGKHLGLGVVLIVLFALGIIYTLFNG